MKIHEIGARNVADVPKLLRELSSRIQASRVRSCIVVLEYEDDDTPDVRMYGSGAEYVRSIGLLQRAVSRLAIRRRQKRATG